MYRRVPVENIVESRFFRDGRRASVMYRELAWSTENTGTKRTRPSVQPLHAVNNAKGLREQREGIPPSKSEAHPAKLARCPSRTPTTTTKLADARNGARRRPSRRCLVGYSLGVRVWNVSVLPSQTRAIPVLTGSRFACAAAIVDLLFIVDFPRTCGAPVCVWSCDGQMFSPAEDQNC